MRKSVSSYRRILSALLAMAMLLSLSPMQVFAAQSNSAVVDFGTDEAAQSFELYSTGAGGFAVQDGMLIPTGDAGEFKAIYKDTNASFSYVSVDIYPGEKGINGGLYLDVTSAADAVNQLEGLYVGIESDFPHEGEANWEDAPNRLDLVIVKFPQWQELYRTVSETGAGNNLFTGGVKEPIKLSVKIEGNTLTVTVSLLSDPQKAITTTYVYEGGEDMGLGNVGIRSNHCDAAYDNFAVIYQTVEQDKDSDVREPSVSVVPTDIVDFDTANIQDKFNFYHSSNGGFAVQDGMLIPTGDAGEFKAIYNKDDGKAIRSVSVEIHPVGNDGIYGGLYINASNPSNDQDKIDALYLGIESNFPQNGAEFWEDAPNRIDIVLGQFAQGWSGFFGDRIVSETGLGNNLFSGGNKEPLRLHAQMEGNILNVTLSLVSNPGKQVTTTYTLPEGTDLTLGDVGIRSHYNNAMYDNFTVEYVADASDSSMDPAMIGFENADAFDLYSTTTGDGGFVAQGGKLVPTGVSGEFKAIYKESGKTVNSVSVEIHPQGFDGPIFGGLYIGGSNASADQDQIDAMYVGIESNFTGWDDALNRIDLVVGEFPAWVEHSRTVSETGLGNNLFANGVKEPITLRVDITGQMLTVTVSLVSDPSVCFGTTYIADRDLSLGQVGIRSHHNNAAYDNFTVNGIEIADAAMSGFDSVDSFNLYSSGEGGFISLDGKLVPAGEPAELKAIYPESGKIIRSVSVELHPHGADSPIYGGLYIGASNAENAQDSINALYLGIESNFTGWEDAANRIDLVVGEFPAWVEHSRTVSETGAANNLFANGVKEPLVLRADIIGNTVTATVSLLRDPSKFISTTYTANWDLSLGQVGIRSHHNDAMYDNFAVNAVASVDNQGYATVNQAMKAANGSTVNLLANTDEAVVVTGDVTIDLAGHHMTNVIAVEGSNLKLADTSSDDYLGAHGSAAVLGSVNPFAQANGKAYLAVGQEGVYTAHHYDVAITHVSLKSSKDALGYKASVYGDETVLANVEAVGFNMWLDGGPVRSYLAYGKQNAVLRLLNIFENNAGEENINAAAIVKVKSGEQFNIWAGAHYATTMKATLQYINNQWYGPAYTQKQREAVIELCNRHPDAISAWGLDNILFEGINFDVPVSIGEKNYTFAQTATYCNGQDIEGQWGVNEHTEEGEYGIGDPFVMRYNGKYYMYPSSGTQEDGVSGVKVFVSDDLVNWSYEGFALEAEEAYQAYAPEVIYYNGWFYMCQSGSQIVDDQVSVGSGHYIYKSQSPTGPFTALTDNFGRKIDGAFWLDDQGNLYFLYAEDYGIRIALVDQSTMLPGDYVQLEASLDGKWVEGPGLFRRGDYLYLTYSGNKVIEENYRIAYSYLEGSDPMGVFIQPEDNVLILKTEPNGFCGLGHNANVIGPDLDSWYVTYHNLLNAAGPQRRYMLDKLVTNGSVVMANGPTYWNVSVPEGPDFAINSIENVDGLWLSGNAATAVYTAEFNFTPAQGGQTRFVFAYANENKYCEALWDDATKTLTVNSVNGGAVQQLGTATIDFLAADVLHTLRVEQGGDRLIVYMDSMRKIDVVHTAVAGKIGVSGAAQFGYTAYSNDAFGTSDFDTVKVVEGSFPAVHYLKGENRGFSIANAQLVNGIRQGEKENTVYNESTGSYDLKLDTEGDWVKYAINVNGDGQYDLSACLDAQCAGTTLQVIVDSNAIYELTVPAAEAEGMVELLLGQLELTAGNHTLKIRLRQGALQVQSFALTAVEAQ